MLLSRRCSSRVSERTFALDCLLVKMLKIAAYNACNDCSSEDGFPSFAVPILTDVGVIPGESVSLRHLFRAAF